MKERVAFIQNVPINDHRMVHTDGVARELVKRGYDVDVIIQESDAENQFEDAPYEIICVEGETYSMLGQMKFFCDVLDLLKRKKYDVIHAKNPFSSVLPALLRKSGAKVVYDVRGLWVDFGVHAGTIPKVIAPFLNKFDVFCMNRADEVIAISHELKRILVSRGVEEQQIEVIVGGGVDVERIRKLENRDIRDFLGIDGKVVGYVGSIGRSRSSERIIEAFEIVRETSDFNVYLVMVGPLAKGEFEYFKRLVKKNHFEGSVFFTGFLPHDEVLRFMKSFDVSISYHENNLPIHNVAVPTKILEYLAAGCGIVVTDQKMYENLLTHKKDCYMTRQDPNSFAQGILSVLKDDELTKRISRNALITAEKYSFKNITDQIEEVYKCMLEE